MLPENAQGLPAVDVGSRLDLVCDVTSALFGAEAPGSAALVAIDLDVPFSGAGRDFPNLTLIGFCPFPTVDEQGVVCD
jgi:hypothetical protein